MKLLTQAGAKARAIVEAAMGKATNVANTIGRGIAAGAMALAMNKLYKVSHERSQIHRDMNRMDKDDEVVSFALSTIANRSTGMEDPTLDAFEVTVQASVQEDGRETSDEIVKRAQWEINQLIQRCGLRAWTWQIIRRFTKYGNEFDEVLVDWDGRNIVGLKQLPEHTVWPNTDDKGTRIPGYEQRPENMLTGKPVQFKEWEILHFAFGELDGYLGTPLLGCARKNWLRLQLAEDSTASARLLRAFMKLVHRVPVNPDWTPEQKQAAIQNYKDKMTKLGVFNQGNDGLENQANPMTVSTDLYLPDDGSSRGGVEMLDPENAQLQNTSDLQYFLNRLITATTIPKRYFPFEGSTPKLSEGGGQAEDKHFACTLMFCQMLLKAGFAELFNRQLILKGIDPNSVRYVMRMAEINTTDQLRAAQTDMILGRAMESFLKLYPEARQNIDIMLREYTTMSDASKQVLMGLEIKDKAPEDDDEPEDDKRVTVPGAGNKEAKGKV